jgi:hypothetical protein
MLGLTPPSIDPSALANPNIRLGPAFNPTYENLEVPGAVLEVGI